ncbi:tetratricopeptide repeat protein [Streptomyces sp. NPDC007369]|uniref:tetratricopeptide repeat protein n=1 Tax=Streptomyces sp. NPDC007369 TaxID=3154589 RepID=UPI00340CFA4A
MAVFEAAGDRYGQAHALRGIGRALLARGETDRALGVLREALAVAERGGEAWPRMCVLRWVADALRIAGRPAEGGGGLPGDPGLQAGLRGPGRAVRGPDRARPDRPGPRGQRGGAAAAADRRRGGPALGAEPGAGPGGAAAGQGAAGRGRGGGGPAAAGGGPGRVPPDERPAAAGAAGVGARGRPRLRRGPGAGTARTGSPHPPGPARTGRPEPPGPAPPGFPAGAVSGARGWGSRSGSRRPIRSAGCRGRGPRRSA